MSYMRHLPHDMRREGNLFIRQRLEQELAYALPTGKIQRED
jgi:hypothetical protein